MAEKTYGIGSGDPAREVNQGGYSPSHPAGGVKTSSGEAADYVLDEFFEGETSNFSIAGTSPKTGLDISTGYAPFTEALTGTDIDYTTNKTPVGSGTANTLGGSWPIQYEPHPGDGVVSKTLPDSPAQTDWTGNKVGDG